MGSAIEQLLSLQGSDDRFDIDQAELLPLQLEAANERFQTRVEAIPLLRNRAENGEVTKIAERKDLVPLLFAHTAYKSYVESWLASGRWDRMAKWLRTVSSNPHDGLDLEGVTSLDDFVERMEGVGSYVSCSSGTTGKPALIPSSEADLEVASNSNVHGMTWATGIVPAGDRRMLGLGPRMKLARNERARLAMIDAFSSEDNTYQMPLPPIGPGSMIDMVVLRRKIADGTASPSEVAAFDGVSTARAKSMTEANDSVIDELIASRHDKLLLGSMFATLYGMAEQVRAKGYSAKDFDEENMLLVGGGLKGTTLPENYREYIRETFNIPERLIYTLYTMQELNTSFPKCPANRYHIAPWVMALPLDDPGEQLVDGDGEITCRAAFFDISLDGRWGGVISGDKVGLDFGDCTCGHRGPTVGEEIVRYADLAGGDKISCAGNIDAYVRGEGS
jgi:hypothetical protein